jgi:tetratricopeptide (TPR) repeat protein
MGNLDLAAFCVQHAAYITDRSKNSSDSFNSTGKIKLNDISVASYNASSLMSNNSTPNTGSNGTVNQSVTQQALVFLFLKKFNKAISVLEHELRIKPNTTVYNLLGRVFMKAKKWKEAVENFDKSIEYNVNNKNSCS